MQDNETTKDTNIK